MLSNESRVISDHRKLFYNTWRTSIILNECLSNIIITVLVPLFVGEGRPAGEGRGKKACTTKWSLIVASLDFCRIIGLNVCTVCIYVCIVG